MSGTDSVDNQLAAGGGYVSADQNTTGSCPGGGQCNGTGGAKACNGCPAYNNRMAKAAATMNSTRSGTPVAAEAAGAAAALNGVSGEPDGAEHDSTMGGLNDGDDMRGEGQEVHNKNAGGQPHDRTKITPNQPVSCQNCSTTLTPLWRRDEEGHNICNACGQSIRISAISNQLPRWLFSFIMLIL